ncbi:MAG: electron transport complex subunit RsxB [Burkholderiales bacterium]
MSEPPENLARRIDAALPQTQCTRCGFADCAAYADAVAAGAANINQCPPGGAQGIARLAAITGRPVIPLNPANGGEGPRFVAAIDENWCIGCTLCIDACPTDAIAGAPKHMHTVIEPRCTGCELCIPVCPVDCIALENTSGERTGWDAWSGNQADTALEQYRARTLRRQCEQIENEQRLTAKAERALADLPAHSSLTDETELAKKRSVIEAALARARDRAKTGRAAG